MRQGRNPQAFSSLVAAKVARRGVNDRFTFPVAVLCHHTSTAWRSAGRSCATSFSARRRPADPSFGLSPRRRAPVGAPVSRPHRPFANLSRSEAAFFRRICSRELGGGGLAVLRIAPLDASGDFSLFRNAQHMGPFRGLSCQGPKDSPTPTPSGSAAASAWPLPKARRPPSVWPFRQLVTTKSSCGSGQRVIIPLALWTQRSSPPSRCPFHLSHLPTSLFLRRLSPLALSQCAALVPQQDGSLFCWAKILSFETVRPRIRQAPSPALLRSPGRDPAARLHERVNLGRMRPRHYLIAPRRSLCRLSTSTLDLNAHWWAHWKPRDVLLGPHHGGTCPAYRIRSTLARSWDVTRAPKLPFTQGLLSTSQ